MEVFAEHRERSAAQADAESTVHIGRRAVVDVAVGGIRGVLTHVGIQERRKPAFLQDDVDHTGDRVGPVLGRRAVTQDLDAIDRTAGQRVEVHAARSSPHAVGEGVEDRHLMPAPAVEENQRMVRAQAAHRKGTHDVVRIRDALPREIDRRCQILQDLTRLARALLRNLLGRENVHRDRELLPGGVPSTRPDHHIDRRQTDGLLGEREIADDGRLADGDLHRLRHVSQEPHAQGVRARRYAADLVASLIVGRCAQAAALGGDHRPRKRRARRIRHPPADRALCQGDRRKERDHQT